MSTSRPVSAASVWKPWGAATRLFGGPPPAGSAVLGRVSSWRSVLGLLTLLALGRGDRSVEDTLNEEGWQKAVTTVTIALVAVPIAIVALYLRTHREFRPQLRLHSVVTRIVLLLLTSFGAMAPIILLVQHTNDLDLTPTTAVEALIALPIGILAIAYALWVAVYICCAAWWAVRSSCFVGDYHPLLGPTVTTVVVITATAISLIQFDTNGVPASDWLILTLGGLPATLVLAAIEYRMLHTRRITWRTGPHPQPTP